MPSSLTATKIKDTYGQLLHVDGGVTSTPKTVYDGDGTATALKVGTGDVQVNNSSVLTDADIGSTVQAYDADLTAWSGKTAPTGTVVGTSDSQALTNKTISGANNTLSNIGNSSLTNSAITIGSTSVSLGATSTTLTGLSSVTSTAFNGALTGNVTGNVSGNAGTVTNGVYTTGDQTIGGNKTFSSNPILSAGTANGVAYLNGSKVLTTGSAFVFDGSNLGLGVPPSAWNTTSYRAIDGSYFGLASEISNYGQTLLTSNAYNSGVSSSPAWKYKNSNAASMYVQSAGQHQWYTAPSGTAGNAISFTQAMTLDASGNLGVGTTSIPYGGIAVYGSTTSFTHFSNANTGSTATDGFSVGLGGDNNAYVYNRESTALILGTSGTERMRIDSSGNVGINTSTPNTRLQANGNVGFYTNNGSDGAQLYLGGIGFDNSGYWNSAPGIGAVLDSGVSTSGALAFYTYAGASNSRSERMRIDSSGNVGIGTSSPGAKLAVIGSGLFNAANAGVTVLNGDATNQQQIRMRMSGTDGVLDVTRDAGTSPNLLFGTEGTERMRIDSSGNLLIGYTSSNGSYKLQVNSQIFATSSTIATSDANYKENVTPLTGALDIITALNPVQFNWKHHQVHNFDTETPTVGFIAQEVQQVFADAPFVNSLIKESEVTLPDGEKEKFLGIAEGNMIAILTKAIQELKAEFDAYKATHP
jgi:hypothetical protein